MKKYKIKDALGKEKIVQAKSVVDAIKKAKTHVKDSVVIGTNEDGIKFTYKNGAFYADGTKLEHDLVKDALSVNDYHPVYGNFDAKYVLEQAKKNPNYTTNLVKQQERSLQNFEKQLADLRVKHKKELDDAMYMVEYCKMQLNAAKALDKDAKGGK